MTGIFIGLPPHPGTLVAGFVLGVMLPLRRRWKIRFVRSWCLKTNMGWPLDGLPPWTGWRTFSPVRFWAHRGLRLGPVGLPLQRLCVYRGRMVGCPIARAISFVSGREAHTGNPPDDGMFQSGADGWFGGPWAQRLLVPDHFFRGGGPAGQEVMRELYLRRGARHQSLAGHGRGGGRCWMPRGADPCEAGLCHDRHAGAQEGMGSCPKPLYLTWRGHRRL